MSFTFSPEAQPFIDNFIANGAKSFEKVGTVEDLRNLYERNCKLCAIPHLEHIYTEDHSEQIDHHPISLRIYDIIKDVEEPPPTVLFIHGGSWVIGNLNTQDSICRKIAVSGKVRVIALDYRLATEYKFPISFEDYQRGLPLVKDTMLWFFDKLTSHSNQLEQLSLLNRPFDKNNDDVLLLSVEHDRLRDKVLIFLSQLVKNVINVEYHHLNDLMHGIFTIAGKLSIAENYLEKIGNYIIQKIHQGNKE